MRAGGRADDRAMIGSGGGYTMQREDQSRSDGHGNRAA